MQKIVLFIEPTEEAYFTPLKIGNLFMNRFAIEENDSSEILKIFESLKFCMNRRCREQKENKKEWIKY